MQRAGPTRRSYTRASPLGTKWVDDRRMTIARHGERPYSITPHANKASALPG